MLGEGWMSRALNKKLCTIEIKCKPTHRCVCRQLCRSCIVWDTFAREKEIFVPIKFTTLLATAAAGGRVQPFAYTYVCTMWYRASTYSSFIFAFIVNGVASSLTVALRFVYFLRSRVVVVRNVGNNLYFHVSRLSRNLCDFSMPASATSHWAILTEIPIKRLTLFFRCLWLTRLQAARSDIHISQCRIPQRGRLIKKMLWRDCIPNPTDWLRFHQPIPQWRNWTVFIFPPDNNALTTSYGLGSRKM